MIDASKQDELNPIYRSRLVVKDFERWSDPDMHTSTPPIDMLRLLVSHWLVKKRSTQ